MFNRRYKIIKKQTIAKAMALIICVITCFNLNYQKIEAAEERIIKDNIFETNGEGGFKLELTDGKDVESQVGLHEIKFKWDVPERFANEDVSYQIVQEIDDVKNYAQANNTKEIKVLNVWPEQAAQQDKKIGDANDAPNKIKEWVEGAIKGTDYEGKVVVTPVNFATFNADSENLLYKGNDGKPYDVVFFGAADSNNYKDLTPGSSAIVEKYIKDGYGVLFGHDNFVLRKNDAKLHHFINFAKLTQYLNLDVYDKDVKVAASDGSSTLATAWGNAVDTSRTKSKVVVKKQGLITTYPFKLPTNLPFEVPTTHSNFEIAFGDVWLAFDPNTTLSAVNNSAYYIRMPDKNYYNTNTGRYEPGTNDFYINNK